MTGIAIDDPQIIPPAPAATASARTAPPAASHASTLIRRHIGWMAIALTAIVLIGMVFAGFSYRRWAWDFTQPGRFRYDINRNFNFGVTGNRVGFLNIYEDQIRDDPPRDTKMDYPPLRLATFQAWAAWTRWRHPDIHHWQGDYAFNEPLMCYYTLLEALACIAAFLIVRHWVCVCARARLPLEGGGGLPLQAGLLRATLAFAVLWFDPGVAIIAHGWPSPNMWAIPIYLWAVLLCLWDCWFIAGLVMGVGAMMQGQQLVIAAVFILWPIFAGRPARAFRWTSGFVFAFMLVAGGWMVTYRPDINQPARQINWPALAWMMPSLALLVVVGMRRQLAPRLGVRWQQAIADLAAISLVWPALLTRDAVTIVVAILAAISLVVLFWNLAWPAKRYLLPLTAGICLLLCIPFFGASTAWWQIGFVYGTERFPDIAMPLANNLPTLLRVLLNWNDIHDVAVTIPNSLLFHWPGEPLPITVRQFMLAIYIALLIPACAAIARQWRRRDPNLLVALVLPWLLFYTILPQMMPRYAVFIAGIGALCIGANFGTWLLVFFFSALTVVQTSVCMMFGNHVDDWTGNPLFNGQMRELLNRSNPGIAWAEVLAAAVIFWVAWTRARPRTAV